MDQDEINCELNTAAARNDFERVKKALEDGAYINCKSRKGRTALHVASHGGRVQMVKYLLENGALVDSTQKNGRTALCVAAANGNLEICRSLLCYGADLNRGCNRGETALHLACLTGRVQVVLMLVDAGANVNRVDFFGQTPLHKSVALAWTNNIEIVTILIENGCDVGQMDFEGRTAKDIAMECGKAAIVECLSRVPTVQVPLGLVNEAYEMPEESLRIEILPMKRLKRTDRDRHVQNIVSQLRVSPFQRERQHCVSSFANSSWEVRGINSQLTALATGEIEPFARQTSLDTEMREYTMSGTSPFSTQTTLDGGVRIYAKEREIQQFSSQFNTLEICDREIPTLTVSNRMRGVTDRDIPTVFVSNQPGCSTNRDIPTFGISNHPGSWTDRDIPTFGILNHPGSWTDRDIPIFGISNHPGSWTDRDIPTFGISNHPGSWTDRDIPTFGISNHAGSWTDRDIPTFGISNHPGSWTERESLTFEEDLNMIERESLKLEEQVIRIGSEIQVFSEECENVSMIPKMNLDYDFLVLKVQLEEMEAKIKLLNADILKSTQIKDDLKRRMKTVKKLRDLRANDESEWYKWNSKLLEMSQKDEDQRKKEADLKNEVQQLEVKITEIKFERDNIFG